MFKTFRKCLLGFGLLIVVQAACVLPGAPVAGPNAAAPLALDPNSIDTAIAGTMAVASTQTAQAGGGRDAATATVAPTKTRSPTPYPTFTLVVVGHSAPMIYVSKNTNCREGPGEDYNIVGALRVGEMAPVLGRSSDGAFWIIRLPGKNRVCWLSGKYATLTGIAGVVPVFTPPPKPKPTRTPTKVPPTHTSAPPAPRIRRFTAAFQGMDGCGGTDWWAEVRLTNTGEVTFQSISYFMEDMFNSTIYTVDSNDFINRNGCDTKTRDTLPPGASQVVSLPALPYDPKGHELIVSISLCPRTGLTGKCVTKILDFTP